VFDWLFEGRSVVYWLLAVLAVIFLLAWWRTRKRNFLLAAVAVAVLAGTYFLLSTVYETPRAQVLRKLREMSDGVKAHDAQAIMKHVAADFRYHGSDRDAFRGSVERALKGRQVDEVVIYDERFPDSADKDTLPVEFMVKPKAWWSENQPAYPVKAKFVREADGQWRLQWFAVYNPVLHNEEIVIPLP
jgi:hypothetical protein